MQGVKGQGHKGQGSGTRAKDQGVKGPGTRAKGQGTRAKGEVQGARAKNQGQRLRIKVHRVSDKGLLGLSCYVLWPSLGSLGALYGFLGDRSHPIFVCLAKTLCFKRFGGFWTLLPFGKVKPTLTKPQRESLWA